MRRFCVIMMGLLVAGGTLASAGEDGDQPSPWFERVSVKGDVRLRYEGFSQDESFDDDRRDRFRFRFRLGMQAKVHDYLKVGFQLRSGNPDDPVSDNQSFDGGFSKKAIAIAEAYADFTPTKNISVIAGKFAPKKLWLVSDMHWDDDVVVEGAMGRYNWKGSGAVAKFDASVYDYILEESKSGGDSYVFGAQVRPTFALGDENQLTVGAGYDSYSRPQGVADLTLGGKLEGNKMTNLLDADGDLVSDFGVANLFAVWKNTSIDGWPIKVSAFGYRNLDAENESGVESGITGETLVSDENDTAYFARVQVGDYKKTGQFMVRYSRYYSEPDAMFYAFTQSDTTRSSNVDGHRVDFRAGLPKKAYVNVTWYNTKPLVGEHPTMDRWQIDYIIAF